ncbi:hypothetical protein [Longirhabdus pacifica]|uniref:hypothetical protein n=1 Tax=Longirhabdus pacifica TaxID=2305227 RepID=UPI0010089332|nr:hypothetical protein [Longirhabdus pacifica]
MINHYKYGISIVIGAVLIIGSLVFYFQNTYDDKKSSYHELNNVVHELNSKEKITLKIVGGNSVIVHEIDKLINMFEISEWEKFHQTNSSLSILAPFIIMEYDIDTIQTELYFDKNSNIVEVYYNGQRFYYKINNRVIEGLEEFILRKQT